MDVHKTSVLPQDGARVGWPQDEGMPGGARCRVSDGGSLTPRIFLVRVVTRFRVARGW